MKAMLIIIALSMLGMTPLRAAELDATAADNNLEVLTTDMDDAEMMDQVDQSDMADFDLRPGPRRPGPGPGHPGPGPGHPGPGPGHPGPGPGYPGPGYPGPGPGHPGPGYPWPQQRVACFAQDRFGRIFREIGRDQRRTQWQAVRSCERMSFSRCRPMGCRYVRF